jgi:hypothetical protein
MQVVCVAATVISKYDVCKFLENINIIFSSKDWIPRINFLWFHTETNCDYNFLDILGQHDAPK